MKTIIMFALIIIAPFLPAQQNPSVELPDFVITGQDVISVKKAEKIQPDFNPTLSDEFFKPAFSPEELNIRNLSSPVKGEISEFDSLYYLKGSLKAGAGIYSLPTADFSLVTPFESGLLEVLFGGKYKLDHVPESERFMVNGGLNLLLTVDNNARFLPGTEFRFGGDFNSTGFKFYASQNPSEKRTLSYGNFLFNISNLYTKQFNFSLQVADHFSYIKEETFSENLIDIPGFLRTNFSNFNIGANFNYKKQVLSIRDLPPGSPVDLGNDDFFSIRPAAGINISEVLKISGGLTYSKSGNRNFTALFVSAGLKLNRYFSLFGEYSPQADFITSGDLLRINRFVNPQNFNNIFAKKENYLNALVKFQYEKYFEIDGGVKYFSGSVLPYFSDSAEAGRFNVLTVDAKKINIYTNLIFHLGPFGIFYGTAEWDNTSDESDKVIPYFPEFRGSLAYGYSFDFGLTAKAKIYFASKSFTDRQNTEEIPAYADLEAGLALKLFPGFFITLDISNIINDDIYYWRGYKETPFDIVGGINYIF